MWWLRTSRCWRWRTAHSCILTCVTVGPACGGLGSWTLLLRLVRLAQEVVYGEVARLSVILHRFLSFTFIPNIRPRFSLPSQKRFSMFFRQLFSSTVTYTVCSLIDYNFVTQLNFTIVELKVVIRETEDVSNVITIIKLIFKYVKTYARLIKLHYTDDVRRNSNHIREYVYPIPGVLKVWILLSYISYEYS